jgi:hypothetical protein
MTARHTVMQIPKTQNMLDLRHRLIELKKVCGVTNKFNSTLDYRSGLHKKNEDTNENEVKGVHNPNYLHKKNGKLWRVLFF